MKAAVLLRNGGECLISHVKLALIKLKREEVGCAEVGISASIDR